jgi:formylmethanofuran dehydrogenase subunit E
MIRKLFTAFCLAAFALCLMAFAQTQTKTEIAKADPPKAKISWDKSTEPGRAPRVTAPVTTGSGKVISTEEMNHMLALHGHMCAGLALGIRTAEAAIRELGEHTRQNEWVAIVENNNCPVDAIQMMTHCTAGRQNLIVDDKDRNVFTFARRSDGKAIRITASFGERDPVFEALRAKQSSGKATPEEKRKFDEMMAARSAAILAASETQALKIESVKIEIPPRK